MKRFYTVKEVAEKFCVCHNTVWYWIKQGTLPHYRAGVTNHWVRIPAEAVDEIYARVKDDL